MKNITKDEIGQIKNKHGKVGDTVGNTQEKVDMKVKNRNAVKKKYAHNNNGEPTLRGGFVADTPDIFGSGNGDD